ncbi:asparagine synthetase B family protein [Citromicrobium bathyomarinum]|uniref:asparagine synthetase B family protein n=1 Tax=Citromicrobium bathyomarinum TaxID=72174 RepID=UPI00315A493F
MCFLGPGPTRPPDLVATIAQALSESGLGPFGDARAAGDFVFAQSAPRGSGIAESDDVIVLADARIDARDDLLAELGSSDSPAMPSDPELILAAWRKWGEACPQHLLGDYAFVVFDPSSGQMFCARDHVGARPLFYAEGAGWIACASDPAILLALPGVDDRLDDDVVLTRLLARRYVPVERTWHRGIRNLPWGHAMMAGRAPLRKWRYWKPGPRGRIRLPTPGDYALHLRKLVEAAVEDRLRGSQRIGLHLSGGLDSTAIAAIAVPRLRECKASEPVGFSWHRRDAKAAPEAEPAWSESVKRTLDIDLHAALPEADVLHDLLRRDVTRHPDPRNLLNELPVQLAAQRLGVDVILSGWGGDQGASFEGRGYRTELLAKGRWIRLWRDLDSATVIGKVRQFALVAWALAGETLRQEGDGPPSGFASAALRRRAQFLPQRTVRKSSVRRTMNDLFDLGAIQSRLNTWAASGARHGIEYRYPLLDRRVLEFVYSIPTDLFVRNGQKRWLMRAAMDDLLPDTVKRHAGKFEPVRLEDLSDPLLGAIKRLHADLQESGNLVNRSDYIDMNALNAWLSQQRDYLQGQSQARVALEFLKFPDKPTSTTDRPDET